MDRSDILKHKCGWPSYDRLLHNPVEDAINIDGDIIILEGNYLLLDEDGWRDVADYADYTVSITADPEMLKERLLARKKASGASDDDALMLINGGFKVCQIEKSVNLYH